MYIYRSTTAEEQTSEDMTYKNKERRENKELGNLLVVLSSNIHHLHRSHD